MSTTTKYGIRRMDDHEPMANVASLARTALDRIDLLLGESSTANVSITPSGINVTTSQRVNYSRSYAALAPLVPEVEVALAASVASTDTVYVWRTSADATGFTLNIRASSVTARSVKWYCHV